MIIAYIEYKKHGSDIIVFSHISSAVHRNKRSIYEMLYYDDVTPIHHIWNILLRWRQTHSPDMEHFTRSSGYSWWKKLSCFDLTIISRHVLSEGRLKWKIDKNRVILSLNFWQNLWKKVKKLFRIRIITLLTSKNWSKHEKIAWNLKK